MMVLLILNTLKTFDYKTFLIILNLVDIVRRIHNTICNNYCMKGI